MDPHLQMWLAIFGVCAGMCILGLIWGFILGRNSKVVGMINLEPIQRLPEDEPAGRTIPDVKG